MAAYKRIYLDLGCGTRKMAGHIGIDKCRLAGVDVAGDIDRGLPLKESTVDGVYSNYFMEHTADLAHSFREIYRVCKNGAMVEMTVPYYASINAFKDPTHKQFFTEETFRYFSKDKWYGSDYRIGTDFELLDIEYHYSHIAKLFPFLKKYIRRYVFNSVGAMTVKLKVRK